MKHASSHEVLLDGLSFPECPRWREGHLWFSEKRARRILKMDQSGRHETILQMDDEPGGIGWLPDGRLLVVAQIGRRLMRLDPDGLHQVADLTGLTAGKCNDMVVDSRGRAYVGHFGFDMRRGESPRPASLVLVTPEGEAGVAAEGLSLPNGCELTHDERTLIVAESGLSRLTAFDVADDGTLSGRRTFAELGETAVDGICLDAEGAVWVADPRALEIVRVREGGEVLEKIAAERPPFACVLGGSDGRSLFLCTDDFAAPLQQTPTGAGRVEVITVDVPAATAP